VGGRPLGFRADRGKLDYSKRFLTCDKPLPAVKSNSKEAETHPGIEDPAGALDEDDMSTGRMRP
jgi:hypothetical protein